MHYVWDISGNFIAEMNGSTGATLRETIHVDAMPLAAINAVASPKKTCAIHADYLNRPVMMTDAAKVSVWAASYEPLGKIRTIKGSATQNLGLPGQWFQLETGLSYNWHGHYDPTTGRYTTPDPLGFVDGPGVYAYAGSNPLMMTDPSGLNPALALPSAICARYPFLCAGTTATIYDFCRRGFTGGGGGGSKKEPKDSCNERFDNDILRRQSIARGFDGIKGEATCRQSASQRYGECLRRRPSAIRTPLAGVDFRL